MTQPQRRGTPGGLPAHGRARAFAPEAIGTGRLVLLPLRPEHAEEMAGVLSDPALYAFTGGAPPTPRSLRMRHERLAAGAPDPTVSWCNWVLELRGARRLVGTVQATIAPSETAHTVPYTASTSSTSSTAEISWVVGTSWQGRGIATEAARGLVTWLTRRPIRTVIAHIHPEHRASQAVAAAIGMTESGLWQGDEAKWQLIPPR